MNFPRLSETSSISVLARVMIETVLAHVTPIFSPTSQPHCVQSASINMLVASCNRT